MSEKNQLGPAAHFREAGTGQGVVCVHSSASYSGHWRALMDRLSDTFRVIAVDLYGYGESPAWPEGREMYPDDEISLLEPAFRSAGEAFHLIGHSYGGAIVLKTALQGTRRIKSLVLYEPTALSASATVDVPTLFLTGSASPASTKCVARLLCEILPRVTVIELDDLGHMGPVTHSERVNESIESFLRETPGALTGR